MGDFHILILGTLTRSSEILSVSKLHSHSRRLTGITASRLYILAGLSSPTVYASTFYYREGSVFPSTPSRQAENPSSRSIDRFLIGGTGEEDFCVESRKMRTYFFFFFFSLEPDSVDIYFMKSLHYRTLPEISNILNKNFTPSLLRDFTRIACTLLFDSCRSWNTKILKRPCASVILTKEKEK